MTTTIHELILDSEMTIEQVVEGLMPIVHTDGEARGICELEGENRGFVLEFHIKRNAIFDA